MKPSRGMGAILPSKQPTTKKRQDGDSFQEFAKGGALKQAINNLRTNWESKKAVNRKMGYAAGNRINAK